MVKREHEPYWNDELLRMEWRCCFCGAWAHMQGRLIE
jgi:hypothetical protein